MRFLFRRCAASTGRTRKTSLRLECLEDRTVPATFTVTNSADTGSGSLRQAIINANALAGADDIVFNPSVFASGTTINLDNSNNDANGHGYNINDSVTIIGPGALNLILDASGNSGNRIFTVDSTQVNDSGGSPINPGAVLTVTISGMTLRNGNDVDGGAIVNSAEILTLQGMEFVNNKATTMGSGGAVWSASGTLNVLQCTFDSNSATMGNGGAIFSDGDDALIENCTFTNNLSAGSGGAITLPTTGGNGMTLRGNTIVGNMTLAASGGGGVGTGASGTLLLTGNIVFGNTNLLGPNDINIGASTVNAASGFNDIGVVTGTAPALMPGVNGNISVNPLLGALQLNGGATRTFLPLSGSPVIDAGGGSGPAVDQRGVARPQGPAFDIGSVEIAVNILPPPPPPPGGPAASLGGVIFDDLGLRFFDTS